MTRSWALQHVADGGSMIRQLTEVHPEGIQAVAFLHLEEIFCPNLWFDDKIKEATYSLAYTIPVTRVRRQEEADTREAAATSPQRP